MTYKNCLLAAVFLTFFASSAVAQSQRTDIHPDANDVQPLLPGMQAPVFEVFSVEGQLDIAYTILSDSGLEATRAFGLAFRVNDEMVERYKTYDIDLEAASGESHHVLPAPSTFIIASDGMIRFQYTNPDYAVRLHPDILLAAARAYDDEVNDRLRRQHKANKEAKNSTGG